jgi:hypothetical protein
MLNRSVTRAATLTQSVLTRNVAKLAETSVIGNNPMVTTLTQNQARGILRALESLVSINASVGKIDIGTFTTFVCLGLGAGFLVKYMGCTVEDYDTLQEFAAAYNLVWG